MSNNFNLLDEREKIINLYNKYHKFLTQSQKQVFHLYYIEDLSLLEISKIVATTRSAVNQSLKSSCNKLYKIEEKLIN